MTEALLTYKIRRLFFGLMGNRMSWKWWEVEDFARFLGRGIFILAAIFGASYALNLLFYGNIIFDGICMSFFFGIVLSYTADLFRRWKTSSFPNKMFTLYIVALFLMIWIKHIQYFQIVHILGIDYKLMAG